MKLHAGKILITALTIAGILVAYIHQMSPSPFLTTLKESFNIVNNDALLNLSVSVIYPMLIAASLGGSLIEQKVGLRRLFILTMAFLGVGILINFIASASFAVFILGRILFGIGFGLGIPFIGAAIMKIYGGWQREAMNTLNALFPFLGTLISFALLVPIYHAFGNSWEAALGIWGIGIVIIVILWAVFVRDKDILKLSIRNADTRPGENQGKNTEKHLYRNLLRNRDLRLLTIIFMCDYFCYSYIAVILPTFLMEIGNVPETLAGIWAALAFPGVGLAGCLVGGVLTARTGRRKPVLIGGVFLEVAGILFATLGADMSILFAIIGIAMFGLGNGLWLPVMYNMPMEISGMNPTRVGAAFAMISSCGFACGFVSPTLGGFLTGLFMSLSGESSIAGHASGLKWSLFAFGFVNLLAFVCSLIIRETGPACSTNRDIAGIKSRAGS